MTKRERIALEIIARADTGFGCGVRQFHSEFWPNASHGKCAPAIAGRYVGKLVKKGWVGRVGIGGEEPIEYYLTAKGLQELEEKK